MQFENARRENVSEKASGKGRKKEEERKKNHDCCVQGLVIGQKLVH